MRGRRSGIWNRSWAYDATAAIGGSSGGSANESRRSVAMTWIEVVDSALKISLGAIVAGGFAYLNARLAHQRDDQARYAARRRDHLEKILELLTEIEHTYISQKGALERYRFFKDHAAAKAGAASQDFSQLDDKLYAEIAKFTRASSVLLMLGQKSANAMLLSYRDAIDEWYQYSILDLDGFPEARLNELSDKIRISRETALAALSESYKSI
jgi:hypothetical protein